MINKIENKNNKSDKLVENKVNDINKKCDNNNNW